ncbi:ATP-dependent DNA helicase [Elysia marginata]|uniref:ATP-dependent DNA helicase n=1 Tax=Elysia marginata TaxID=1093978 RepID=A0AAV4GD44_9GAST|nr:ATP-dependent DNA helicase [Elysia marginata]
MRFLTIYRPPPSKKNKLTFTMFKDEFQNFAMEKSLCNGYLIFIGDFNIHVENENGSQGKWLMELFYSLNLKQHIRELTHDGGHTLDLLVTQKNNSFVKVEECHFSDHKSIHFIISAKKPKPTRKTLKYRKTKDIDMEAY